MSEEPIIAKTEMSALLSRPLKKEEDTNYNLYLNIATMRLADRLCLEALPSELPDDLKLLVSGFFGSIRAQNKRDNSISSKKNEDFSASYNNSADDALTEFLKANWDIVAKYSQCQAEIRNGKVSCDDSFRLI